MFEHAGFFYGLPLCIVRLPLLLISEGCPVTLGLRLYPLNLGG